MIYACCVSLLLNSCIAFMHYTDRTVGGQPVEPTESVEPEPGVQFVVEPEVNLGKQLSIIPCTYLI